MSANGVDPRKAYVAEAREAARLEAERIGADEERAAQRVKAADEYAKWRFDAYARGEVARL